jgi:hypothetical protein
MRMIRRKSLLLWISVFILVLIGLVANSIRVSRAHRLAILTHIQQQIELKGALAFVPLTRDTQATPLHGPEGLAVVQPFLDASGCFWPFPPNIATASDGNSIEIEVLGHHPVTIRFLMTGRVIVEIPDGEFAGKWTAWQWNGRNQVEKLLTQLHLKWPEISDGAAD